MKRNHISLMNLRPCYLCRLANFHVNFRFMCTLGPRYNEVFNVPRFTCFTYFRLFVSLFCYCSKSNLCQRSSMFVLEVMLKIHKFVCIFWATHFSLTVFINMICSCLFEFSFFCKFTLFLFAIERGHVCLSG